jgi:hypothetical protein
MHTPSAALGWELWRRHRPRILGIIGLVLGFALVYPLLCALVGFNLDSRDALVEVVKQLAAGSSAREGPPSPLMVLRVLFLLFLACGPVLAMVMSLLFVTWMFTFTEIDPRTKDLMTFPARLFTLPVSTSFLSGWLVVAGMASIAVLYASWKFCVRMPHIETFTAFQNGFVWLALLPLAQGIVLVLGGWPKVRVLLLSGILFGFVAAPGWRPVFESPPFLALILLLGMVLTRVGLQKMRHGQWQACMWKWPFGSGSARAEMRGPQRFASPAQAQLWFEWRRFARPLCFAVAGLALVPVALHLLVRVTFHLGPLQGDTIPMFAVYLIALPVFLHFCSAISPSRGDLPFLMNRPLTNGEMMMATLKTAAISTMISWGTVLVALCGLPWLGDWHQALKPGFDSPQSLTILFFGLILQTWRLIPVNLGFVLSGNRRLAELPVWMLVAFCFGWMALAWMSQVEEYWQMFWRMVPALLACLVALKIGLACVAFRLCLKRRLLARSALIGYLAFWFVLVAGLLAALVLLLPPSGQGFIPAALAVVLLVPLARIGFGPIALTWSRHA